MSKTEGANSGPLFYRSIGECRMSMDDRFEDDGYRGFLLNPKTKQVLKANAATVLDSFYIRVDGPNDTAKVRTSKPLADALNPPKLNDKPVVEATPEAEDKVDEDSGELALITIEAEVRGCEDKGTLKDIGSALGLKLTKAMNTDPMQERIASQIAQIRAASTGE